MPLTWLGFQWQQAWNCAVLGGWKMETRMKKYRQVSPERAKVWTEKSPKYHQLTRKVPVVYYICRNRQLEHPHFIEVLLSSRDGLYLRGNYLIDWLIDEIMKNADVLVVRLLLLLLMRIVCFVQMWSRGLMFWEAGGWLLCTHGLARGKSFNLLAFSWLAADKTQENHLEFRKLEALS